MSRQDANAAFARTSFLYGGNAPYIEQLYARYEADPKAVDAEWQSFFQSLKDDARDVSENARGPSWQRPDWPLPQSDELATALGAEWVDIGPTEPGYWAMLVPSSTRAWPIGRVYRFVALGHRARDLVSYYLELEARAREME